MNETPQTSKLRQKTVFIESIKQGYSLWHFPRYQKIADMVNEIRKKYVLDVGCGIGLQDCLLTKKEIIGFDIDPQTIKKAQNITRSCGSTKNSSYSFIVADLESPPLKKQTFDIILCTEVLEHLRDDKKALEITLPLLKKNGLLILTIPNTQRLSLTRTLKSRNKKKPMSPTHIREYEIKSVNTLLKSISTAVKINKIKGIYLDFPPFLITDSLLIYFRRLRSSTIFQVFTYNILYRLYEKLWSKLERHLWQQAFFLLLILQHQ